MALTATSRRLASSRAGLAIRRRRAADALIAVRYERDSSDMKQLVLGRHVLVVDEMLLSPSIPQQVRGPVHAALLQCLVELGRFHNQKVLVWDDFHDPTGHFGI